MMVQKSTGVVHASSVHQRVATSSMSPVVESQASRVRDRSTAAGSKSPVPARSPNERVVGVISFVPVKKYEKVVERCNI